MHFEQYERILFVQEIKVKTPTRYGFTGVLAIQQFGSGQRHIAKCPAAGNACDGRAVVMVSRTNSSGGGDKVDEPEEHVGSPQGAGSKHDDSEEQRQEEEDGQLLHHLGNKVCDWPVQPVIALPACNRMI